MVKNVFDLVKTEEELYQTVPVSVVDGYEWSMFEHIRTTILYKNSQLLSGKDDSKPVKNIILPMLRLQYRTEGFDVKDIAIYVDDKKSYYKSMLVRKYHDQWARQNDIDTFIDELVESYVDFGGALVKNVNSERPEVVKLQTIAFCDQTDILSGPFAIKHNYSPSQLLEMEKQGWGKFGTTLEDVIALSENQKEDAQNPNGKINQTPGKYIEVYEVHGTFPESYYKDEGSDKKYVGQMHIICFYKDSNGDKQGITLYKGKEAELPFKIVLRDEIFGRALGLGGAEELFDSQIWTTYDQIRIKGMLDQASKMLYQTADATFANRNKTNDLDNGEILIVEEGKTISPFNTQPVNLQVFENNIQRWTEQAQIIAGASDALLGQNPSSGTPFKLQEAVISQGQGLHDYRRGKLATFVDEIYRDWIIPQMAKEISKGKTFLSELSLDELQSVAEALVVCQTNDMIKERILNGELIGAEEIETFKQESRAQFMKGGNKRFIEIFKDEFSDTPLDVKTNVAGKQKNLAQMTDKVGNVVRQILASPQMLDDPRLAKLTNEILEFSGLSQIDSYQKPPQPQAPQPSPMQPELATQ